MDVLTKEHMEAAIKAMNKPFEQPCIYVTRLEADRTLTSIKKEYPGAIILATEIDLKE